jgi:hypothetical protein
MQMTEDLFASGLLFDSFVDESETGERFRVEFSEAVIPDDVAGHLANLDKQRYVIALMDDQCRDLQVVVPVIARCCVLSPYLVLRVFRRDEHPELTEQLAENERELVPIIVVFDEQFEELNQMTELPEAIIGKVSAQKSKLESLTESDPERSIVLKEKAEILRDLRRSGETARLTAEAFAEMVCA